MTHSLPVIDNKTKVLISFLCGVKGINMLSYPLLKSPYKSLQKNREKKPLKHPFILRVLEQFCRICTTSFVVQLAGIGNGGPVVLVAGGGCGCQ